MWSQNIWFFLFFISSLYSSSRIVAHHRGSRKGTSIGCKGHVSKRLCWDGVACNVSRMGGGQSTVCTPLTPQPRQMRSRNRCSSSLWRGRYYNLKVAELIVLLFIGFYFDVNAGGCNLYPFCRRPADRWGLSTAWKTSGMSDIRLKHASPHAEAHKLCVTQSKDVLTSWTTLYIKWDLHK